jgi:hypothetical protein
MVDKSRPEEERPKFFKFLWFYADLFQFEAGKVIFWTIFLPIMLEPIRMLLQSFLSLLLANQILFPVVLKIILQHASYLDQTKEHFWAGYFAWQPRHALCSDQ